MEFKNGDKVYHKNLKMTGMFIGYAWESKEEADVEFEMEDGYIEQKHVSINQLEKIKWRFYAQCHNTVLTMETDYIIIYYILGREW